MSSPRQTGRALSRRQIAPAILGLLLFIAAHASGACFPPILVINSSAYAGAAITGSNAWEYNDTADSGVLVLDGSGNVYWGPNSSNLTVTGTWDGGYTVTTSAATVQVPQVLLFFSGTTDAMTMQGYDGNTYSPLCNSALGSSGTCYVQAFNGITGCSFYVFDFYDPITQDTSSCYRFCTGPGPVRIHAENGWPPSDVFTFPSSVYIDGQLFTSSYFDEGISNPGTDTSSYWSQMYFVSTSGTVSNWAEFSTALASDSPTGDIYGNIGNFYFSDEWNPRNGAYTAEAGMGISPAPPTGPSYGPPSVDWYGDLLPFAYTDLEGDDVYVDFNTYYQVIIDSGGSVTASQPTSNLSGGYSGEVFSNLPGFAAVTGTGNGMRMVGLPPGVVFLSDISWWGPWEPYPDIYTSYSSNWSGEPPDYILYKPDGTAVFKYVSDLQPAAFFNFPNWSDQYAWVFTGTDVVLDFRSGTPPSNITAPTPSLPSTMYADNQLLSEFLGEYPTISGTTLSYEWCYDGDYEESSYGFYWYPLYMYAYWNINLSGTTVTGTGSFNYWNNNTNVDFYGSMDQNGNFTPQPGYGNNYISEGLSFDSPQTGPPEITWDDTTLSFEFTGDDGADNYSDWQGDLNVIINGDGSVIASDTTTGVTIDGTYNTANTQWFNFGNAASMEDFAAQDSNGNIEGIAPGSSQPGLEMYFYESGNASTIQLGNGTYLSPSNCQVYTWQRNDGTEGVLYSGTAIPANSPILIQDYNGNYSSPVYIDTVTGSNDFTEDCTMNGWPDSWPTTDLYPPALYVNGNYSTLDMSTLTTSGSGQNQSASVSYDVQPTIDGTSNGLVTVNWSWSTAGFSGGVSGSFGAYSSFSGAWDGTWFTNLPPGLIVTTNPPPVLPTGYPPEISWNGVDLSFDPTASSVSGTNESGYDIYHDDAGLGLTAEISPTTGQVILIGANGTQYNGSYSYNSGTGSGQFTFTGTSPGNVAPVGTGFGGPPPVSGTGTEIAGDLDITGNYLTMGTWVANGDSVNALAISYADTTGTNPSQVQFSATRASIDWLWTEATSDNTEPQVPMMEVDPTHRVLVHDTTPQNVPTVILNPNGPSSFKKGLRVPQQGDVSMGTFTTGTAP